MTRFICAMISRVEVEVEIPDGTYYNHSVLDKAVKAKCGDKLADMMADTAESYGTQRFPNMDLCAKSGTAEVGGGSQPHAWFVGFIDDPDHPLAFVVLVENGGSGASVAGSVAAKVLAQATAGG